MRVLTKDRREHFRVPGIVGRLLQMVQQAQRQIDHGSAFGDDLGLAPEARKVVADVAVVLLDGERQVFSGEVLLLRDQAMVTLPVVSDEGFAAQADLVEQPAAGCVITPTQNPGHNAPCINVIGAPEPEFGSLFFR